ncbi:DUF6875 domain-containing protein [Longimicrobium sp.]|uniref:DUF6875 domain-containing protein n=1 Tax=Longimicrobium sp. TaxID=2029185 RepID=UPI002E2FB6E0|nr:hypothetical protein [Longimicrobium sp.]HEX6040437.1 hypothetical protein [Longimicrobium sp.]
MMLVSPTDPPLYLAEPRDVEGDRPPARLRPFLSQARAVLRWARAYLCSPHAQLGRDGPVCPYTQPSLDRTLFWLAFHPGADPAPDRAAAAIGRYRDWFLRLPPEEGPEAQYKAILVLFPELPHSRAPRVVDGVQAALKPAFVSAGLMIGQFHAGCAEPALWNPGFHPLRSPVPLLAIRHMVRTDAAFLVRDAGSLDAYLRRFGDCVPARLEPVVREAAARFGMAFARTS